MELFQNQSTSSVNMAFFTFQQNSRQLANYPCTRLLHISHYYYPTTSKTTVGIGQQPHKEYIIYPGHSQPRSGSLRRAAALPDPEGGRQRLLLLQGRREGGRQPGRQAWHAVQAGRLLRLLDFASTP